MTRRRLVGVTAVVIAVAITIVAIAGRDGTPPPAQGQDPRPAAGDYTGRSSQRLPVTVTVAEDRRTLTLDVRWRCKSPRDPSAGSVLVFRHRSVAIARDGSFSARADSSDVPARPRRPRASRDGRASGRLSATWSGDYAYVTDDTDIRCASGDVTFEVRRRRSARGPAIRVALDGPREVAVAAGRVWVLEQGQPGPAVVSIDPGRGSHHARPARRPERVGRASGIRLPARPGGGRGRGLGRDGHPRAAARADAGRRTHRRGATHRRRPAGAGAGPDPGGASSRSPSARARCGCSSATTSCACTRAPAASCARSA